MSSTRTNCHWAWTNQPFPPSLCCQPKGRRDNSRQERAGQEKQDSVSNHKAAYKCTHTLQIFNYQIMTPSLNRLTISQVCLKGLVRCQYEHWNRFFFFCKNTFWSSCRASVVRVSKLVFFVQNSFVFLCYFSTRKHCLWKHKDFTLNRVYSWNLIYLRHTSKASYQLDINFGT